MQQIVRTLSMAAGGVVSRAQVLICDRDRKWSHDVRQRHFRHAITKFVEHCHRERNHQGLDNRLIAGTPVTDRTRRVRCRPRLGGLLNFYERAA
jgi:hypothetical protein